MDTLLSVGEPVNHRCYGGKSHRGLITSERKASFFDSGHPHRLDKSSAFFPAGQLKRESKFFTMYRFQHHSLFNFVRLKLGGTALVELTLALKLCEMSNSVGVQGLKLFPIEARCKFSVQKCSSNAHVKSTWCIFQNPKTTASF